MCAILSRRVANLAARPDAIGKRRGRSGARGALVDGDAQVFASSPLLMDIQVPGGTWQMAAVPRQGWQTRQFYTSPYFHLGLAISLLLALLTGLRYDRAKEFVTDTKKVHQKIPLIGIDDLKKILPLGCIPVAVELVEGARPLPEYTHPDRALYIFGPEDGSLDKEIRDWCEDVVYIPTTGCMNLAATVNVVLYDRMAKIGRAHV